MTIGSNIRKYRLAKGLTLKELGKLCHLAETTLSAIELDVSATSIKSLKRIAAALEINIAFLIQE